jgi:hypothetical protein
MRFLRGCRFRHLGRRCKGAHCVPLISCHGFLGIALKQKEMVGQDRSRYLDRSKVPASIVKKISAIGLFDLLAGSHFAR